MSNESESGTAATAGGPDPTQREVRYEYSRNLAPLLSQLGVSLVISTYQAGKLVVVGLDQHGALALSFHNFERAMGVAVRPDRIAVGTLTQIWFLRSAPDIAPRLVPAGRHDACFLARSSHMTGDIHIHEMAWAGEELWLVNTRFSCLCTLDENHSFVPKWRPPFITALAGEDRCHLNGMALADGRPQYVTVMAETDIAQGWRPNKATTGCLIDVATGRTVARGFAMPHSPRLHQGRRLAARLGDRPAGGSGSCVRSGDLRRSSSRVTRAAWPCTARMPSSGYRRSARHPPSAGCRSRHGARACVVGSAWSI